MILEQRSCQSPKQKVNVSLDSETSIQDLIETLKNIPTVEVPIEKPEVDAFLIVVFVTLSLSFLFLIAKIVLCCRKFGKCSETNLVHSDAEMLDA